MSDSLAAFVDWFRADLAYKPPESWPDHLEWFFSHLKHRYGAAVDPEPQASGPPAGLEGISGAVMRARLSDPGNAAVIRGVLARGHAGDLRKAGRR